MLLENLTCPISHDLLEDPINLPCCGTAISRQSLLDYFNVISELKCPLCRAILDTFDASLAPKAINLAYMVEEFKKANLETKEESKDNITVSSYIANLYPIYNKGYRTKIAKLEFKSKQATFKTHIIPVIDVSGSMSGNPLNQAKYSLGRIVDLTFQTSNNITSIVTYSDNYKIINIDTNNNSLLHYKTIVDRITIEGGTSFTAAFKGICSVIDCQKNNALISNIVVIFLTDGEDSSINASGRIKLVEQLIKDIKPLTTKPVTIHSIGFGQNHDFEFLNNLRLSHVEGCYKYANPSEDYDSLSNKVNSIIDVIMANSYIPLKVLDTLDIIHDYKDNTYFIDITKKVPNEIKVLINNENNTTIPITIVADNDPDIKNSWYGYLIDQVAQEIIQLSQVDINVLDNKLHLELLEKRCKAIMLRINECKTGNDNNNDNDNNNVRLTKLMEMMNNIKKNIKVDKLKLVDMASEGKFKTSNQTNQPTDYRTGATHVPYAPSQSNTIQSLNKTMDYIDKNCLRSDIKGVVPSLIESMYVDSNCNILKQLQDPLTNLQMTDTNNSNLLIIAACTGRISVVEYLLETDVFDMQYKNKNGYNALDCAVIKGFWKSAEILIDHGAKVNYSTLLFKTCIHNNYFITAKLLLKNKFLECNSTYLDYKLTSEQIKFINNNNNGSVSIETIIFKGLYEKAIEYKESISWRLFLPVITKLSEDQYKIIEHYISTKQLDVDEIITEGNDATATTNTNTLTWPLFIACEKGIIQLYNTIMQNLINSGNTESINRQNEKGTTPLWIASCNKHIDIVLDLLNNGAQPNISNNKGDSPLIAAIQKGVESIIEILLSYGADISLSNTNRDNCVLIACRNGQSKILKLLLQNMDNDTRIKYFNMYASIDGFAPLLAATELDKVGCIQVLHEFGADLSIRSEDNNKILSGATAVHLACYYNRLIALKCLIDLGCSLTEQTTTEGLTPLHIAIKQGHTDITRYLLSLPAGQECLKIEDNNGKRPEFYAKGAGNEEILEEFFSDTLANTLSTVINKCKTSEKSIIKECSNKIITFGQSLTCYEYTDIYNTSVGIDNFSTYSLLTGNADIINCVNKMREIDNNKLITDSDSNINNIQDTDEDFEFWTCLTSGIQPKSAKIQEQIDRLKTAITNVQNKLLLDIKNVDKFVGGVVDQEDTLNSSAKMNNGFTATSAINKEVIDKLKASGSNKLISLLGFLNKIKDKKTLDYLLTEAKISAIKHIKNGCELSVLHLIVLYLYTGHLEIHNQVNLSLLDWNSKNIYCPLTECLYQAINCLSVYQGEVYRAVSAAYDANTYDVGKTITWNTFSIGSHVWSLANTQVKAKTGMIFIIKNKTGKLLSPYSKYQADAEVVYLPGTSFIVTNHYRSSIICLGQANIRESTFKMQTNDYNKVLNGTEAIIIELEEISN
jgi:ankyrin repeat protein/Mg-chelatase subunit ChlD